MRHRIYDVGCFWFDHYAAPKISTPKTSFASEPMTRLPYRKDMSFFNSVPRTTDGKPLHVCNIKFEELSGELTDGVTTRPVAEISVNKGYCEIDANLLGRIRSVSSSVASRRREAMDNYVEKIHQDMDGNYTITIGSYAEREYLDSDNGNWSTFKLHGLEIIKEKKEETYSGSKTYVKVTHTYKVKVVDESVVPYAQFSCNVPWVKYAENIFRRGDVITVFVPHHKMPLLPSPSVLSVNPKVDQTFIPMMPRQRLQVITDFSKDKIDFKLDSTSALLYCGNESYGKNKNIGEDVFCHYFECVKDPETQELVFVNSDNKAKTICVPVLDNDTGHKRYPVIIDPVKSSMIYRNNIDGFILRSFKTIKLRIDKECPLQPIYIIEKFEFSEVKLKIMKPRPFFILERADTSWVASCD